MRFQDLFSLPRINLYAGDIPEPPEYHRERMIGLSMSQDDECHIRHDLTNPLPIKDESVDYFQSEDVFEHIEYSIIPSMIAEICRVLKKGCLFRLSLPDYRCDVLRERSVYDKKGNLCFDPFGGGLYKRRFPFFRKKGMHGGHVWFPTYELVSALFKNAAFSSIEFLHFYDENGVPHMKDIDYSRGFIQRTSG